MAIGKVEIKIVSGRLVLHMIPAAPHTCLSMHWSHDLPEAPTLQRHWPVTGSHGPGNDPQEEHLHSSQWPPGTCGLPW